MTNLRRASICLRVYRLRALDSIQRCCASSPHLPVLPAAAPCLSCGSLPGPSCPSHDGAAKIAREAVPCGPTQCGPT